jgi:hypothetical protein
LTELKKDRENFSKELRPEKKQNQFKKIMDDQDLKIIDENDSFEKNENYIYDEVQKEISALKNNSNNIWDKESKVLSKQQLKEEQQREVAHKILEKYNTNDNMGPETIPEEESITDISVLSPLNSSHKIDPSNFKNKINSQENQDEFVLAPKFTKSEDKDIRKNIFQEMRKSDLETNKEQKMMKVHTFGGGKFSQLENVDVSLSESEEEDEIELPREKQEKKENNFISSIQMKIQNLKNKFKSNQHEIIQNEPKKEVIIKKEKLKKTVPKKKEEKNDILSEKEQKKERQRELRRRRMNYKPMLSKKSK